MPLSEQEQRLLDELERNLYQSGQDRVVNVDPRGVQLNYRTLVLGIVIVVAGLITLLVGVSLKSWVVGIIGFAAMFGGVILAISSPRAAGKSSAGGPAKKTSAAGGKK